MNEFSDLYHRIISAIEGDGKKFETIVSEEEQKFLEMASNFYHTEMPKLIGQAKTIIEDGIKTGAAAFLAGENTKQIVADIAAKAIPAAAADAKSDEQDVINAVHGYIALRITDLKTSA